VALSISRHGGSQGRRRVRCAGRGFSTNEEVVVAVSGNGSGGASIDHGSELRGLADRIEALGGQLDLKSPSAGGTVVRATRLSADEGSCGFLFAPIAAARYSRSSPSDISSPDHFAATSVGSHTEAASEPHFRSAAGVRA
jgi:hypothetical protein